MFDWLMRVLGLGPAEAPVRTPPVFDVPPRPPAPFTPPPAVGPRPRPGEAFEPEAPEPPDEDDGPAAAHGHPAPAAEPMPAFVPLPEDDAPAAPDAPAGLQWAAFSILSSANGRLHLRADGQLAHVTEVAAPEGGAVFGYVTDSHPGILFLHAADGGPVRIGEGEPALLHAFRMAECGTDGFSLQDLSTDGYLSALQFAPGENLVENDRGAVQAWEVFTLVPADGAPAPEALPGLLPPAGLPIAADSFTLWRGPAHAG